MASGRAPDTAESQPLFGAVTSGDMDLTDMSFNEFFSFTDDVGETLDREMHHSLFGDSGLGMDLGSLMGPPADQLLPDIATQLFDDVAGQETLPDGGRCEVLVKHVRRSSQSAVPDPLPPVVEGGSPLRQALWDHSYCSRGNSGASSPAPEAELVCKVPSYLEQCAPNSPPALLQKVPPYVQGVPPASAAGGAPFRKKLSLSDSPPRGYRLDALSSRRESDR
ncbi:uncharacterized protein LOC119090127 [Pollicipes pollicipes]|uniref:uncharacterized protein LOC119090127 n=1 Tax=Pollicipes pollicipes TaxID=41117 RepID=UPI001884BA5D|nr:uncharacterized protein LOC119090127 [Pollicipes pollicipes]